MDQYFTSYYKNLANNIHIPILRELDSIFHNIESQVEYGDLIGVQDIDNLIERVKNTLGTSRQETLKLYLEDCKRKIDKFNQGDAWSVDSLFNGVFKVYVTYHEILYWELLIKTQEHREIYELSREIFCLDHEQKKYEAPVLYRVRRDEFTKEDWEKVCKLKEKFKNTSTRTIESFVKEMNRRISQESQNESEILRESIKLFQAQCWMFVEYMKGD